MSFFRKKLALPKRAPVSDEAQAARARMTQLNQWLHLSLSWLKEESPNVTIWTRTNQEFFDSLGLYRSEAELKSSKAKAKDFTNDSRFECALLSLHFAVENISCILEYLENDRVGPRMNLALNDFLDRLRSILAAVQDANPDDGGISDAAAALNSDTNKLLYEVKEVKETPRCVRPPPRMIWQPDVRSAQAFATDGAETEADYARTNNNVHFVRRADGPSALCYNLNGVTIDTDGDLFSNNKIVYTD